MKRLKLLAATVAILTGGVMAGAGIYAILDGWWLLLIGGVLLIAGGIMMDVDE